MRGETPIPDDGRISDPEKNNPQVINWDEGIADEYREFLNDRKGNVHLGLEVAERFVTNVTVGVISNAIGSG